jgi:hypothetical protein
MNFEEIIKILLILGLIYLLIRCAMTEDFTVIDNSIEYVTMTIKDKPNPKDIYVFQRWGGVTPYCRQQYISTISTIPNIDIKNDSDENDLSSKPLFVVKYTESTTHVTFKKDTSNNEISHQLKDDANLFLYYNTLLKTFVLSKSSNSKDLQNLTKYDNYVNKQNPNKNFKLTLISEKAGEPSYYIASETTESTDIIDFAAVIVADPAPTAAATAVIVADPAPTAAATVATAVIVADPASTAAATAATAVIVADPAPTAAAAAATAAENEAANAAAALAAINAAAAKQVADDKAAAEKAAAKQVADDKAAAEKAAAERSANTAKEATIITFKNNSDIYVLVRYSHLKDAQKLNFFKYVQNTNDIKAAFISRNNLLNIDFPIKEIKDIEKIVESNFTDIPLFIIKYTDLNIITSIENLPVITLIEKLPIIIGQRENRSPLDFYYKEININSNTNPYTYTYTDKRLLYNIKMQMLVLSSNQNVDVGTVIYSNKETQTSKHVFNINNLKLKQIDNSPFYLLSENGNIDITTEIKINTQ